MARRNLTSIKRRAAYYLLAIAVLIVLATLLYDWGMRTFEPTPYPPPGVEISLLHSMQVVVETFTATGYGSDSPWHSAEMNLMVMALDLTGVALFFLALPAVLLPVFQRALSASAPTELEEAITDHVVICSYTQRAEVLIDELTAHDVPYVLVEPDEETAIELDEDGYRVVHADPESVADLRQLRLDEARALVADVSDRVDASIVLAAKEATEDIRVLSVVEDPDRERYHELAGADVTLSPRQLLGEALAGKVTTGLSANLDETVHVGQDFDVVEVPIRHGSDLDGTTLAESGLRETYGVNVIGAWIRGEFVTPLPPERELTSGSILLITGGADRIRALTDDLRSTARPFRHGETVVLGHGEVGQAVVTALAAADVPCTVVDTAEQNGAKGVDVVGDATDPEVLEQAGVPGAQSVVLALPDDTATEFTTLVTRDLTREAEVLARANSVGAIRKTYRAGADYVLSLATVSGRAVASEILRDEEILAVGTTVDIIQTSGAGLAGETLASARVRERTNCTVIAISRNGKTLTDLDPDVRIHSEDQLIVAGTDAGTNEFVELFGPDEE